MTKYFLKKFLRKFFLKKISYHFPKKKILLLRKKILKQNFFLLWYGSMKYLQSFACLFIRLVAWRVWCMLNPPLASGVLSISLKWHEYIHLKLVKILVTTIKLKRKFIWKIVFWVTMFVTLCPVQSGKEQSSCGQIVLQYCCCLIAILTT